MDPSHHGTIELTVLRRFLFSAAEVSKTQPEETYDPIWGSDAMASMWTVTRSLPAASQSARRGRLDTAWALGHHLEMVEICMRYPRFCRVHCHVRAVFCFIQKLGLTGFETRVALWSLSLG